MFIARPKANSDAATVSSNEDPKHPTSLHYDQQAYSKIVSTPMQIKDSSRDLKGR